MKENHYTPPFKVPVSEYNSEPSIATFEPVNPDSVRTRLTEAEIQKMPTNGYTIETLRDFAPLNRHDKIDQIGIATNMLAENTAKYSKSGFHAALMNDLQRKMKPKN